MRRRDTLATLSVILVAALAVSGFFTYNIYQDKRQYQTFLQNSYQRSFREMVTNVENIGILLDKERVTASATQSGALLSQIWRQSFTAADNLGRLPVSHLALSKTSKFLNQVGDYCYTLSVQNIGNKMPDDNQMAQVDRLRQYSGYLLDQLHAMQQDVNNGKISFGEMRKNGRVLLKTTPTNVVDRKFTEIQDKYSQYPTMIYDGPFSENMMNTKPKGLINEANVDINKAKAVATKFVGANKIGRIVEASSGKGMIDTYGLELIPKGNDRKNSIYIDITKTGGHVLWMIDQRNIVQRKLTDAQAKDIARKFLKEQGFGNLAETYTLKNDNTITITFIGIMPDGILVYPDLMKVKVALDNGEIVGFDSYQYLMAHRQRTAMKPTLTQAQAQAKVNPKLRIDRIKLAIIPIPGDKEALCYEFKCRLDDTDYFVYINAQTGKEENILRIINVPNGTLTQ